VAVLLGFIALKPQELGHVASSISSLDVQDQVEGVGNIALNCAIGEIYTW
jgi:hypothetical protein